MTTPNKNELLEEQTERDVPEITSEEDVPLIGVGLGSTYLSKTQTQESLGSQQEMSMPKARFFEGVKILKRVIWLMVGLIILDLGVSFLKFESNLIESAFDTFKLITMTVLGYVFGSENKDESSK